MKGVILHRFPVTAVAVVGWAVLGLGVVSLTGCITAPLTARGTCGDGTCGGCDGANGCGSGHGGDRDGVGPWNLIDRCYPQRYWHASEKEVNNLLTPQVQNGHVLDQTMWTYYFEPGTDRLTPAGLEKLGYIIRRRPCPDTMVYLQTANDIIYDPACPERFAGARQELDGLRVQALQKFLVAASAGRPADFQVVIHDPSDTSVPAAGPATILNRYTPSLSGRLSTAGGGSSGSSAAVSGTSGGGSTTTTSSSTTTGGR
jgi:hypothetical protein